MTDGAGHPRWCLGAILNFLSSEISEHTDELRGMWAS